MQSSYPDPKHVFLEFANNESDDNCEVNETNNHEVPIKNIKAHEVLEVGFKT